MNGDEWDIMVELLKTNLYLMKKNKYTTVISWIFILLPFFLYKYNAVMHIENTLHYEAIFPEVSFYIVVFIAFYMQNVINTKIWNYEVMCFYRMDVYKSYLFTVLFSCSFVIFLFHAIYGFLGGETEKALKYCIVTVFIYSPLILLCVMIGFAMNSFICSSFFCWFLFCILTSLYEVFEHDMLRLLSPMYILASCNEGNVAMKFLFFYMLVLGLVLGVLHTFILRILKRREIK